VRRLFLPTVVVAVAVVLDRGWLWPVPRETLLLQIHRGVCAAAFLLAWRFRRGGIAAAALLLAAAVEALRLAPPEGSGLALLLLPAVALLLPADLALLGLSKLLTTPPEGPIQELPHLAVLIQLDGSLLDSGGARGSTTVSERPPPSVPGCQSSE